MTKEIKPLDRPPFKDFTLLVKDRLKLNAELDKVFGDVNVVVQPKFDGRWGVVLHEHASELITLWSRHGKLQKEWTHKSYASLPSFALHGEYIFGTSFAKSSPLEGQVMLFDCEHVADKRGLPLHERLAKLVSLALLIRNLSQYDATASLPFSVVDDWTICSGSDPVEMINDLMSPDYEGLVLKSSIGLWGDTLVRIKPIYDMDYVIMGFYQSDAPKYKGKMVKSIKAGLWIDGELTEVCNVSGLNEADRARFYEKPNLYLGKVITCSGKDVFKSGALRHPNFVRFHPTKLSEECVLIK